MTQDIEPTWLPPFSPRSLLLSLQGLSTVPLVHGRDNQGLVSDMSSRSSSPPSPEVLVRIESPMGIDVVLEWQHLSLKVEAPSIEDESGPKEKKILDDVSGVARSGELVVLMGPSGAGKTSLLDCLAERNRRATGRVTVNGTPLDDSMKAPMTFVVQDDLFYERLTVREHLIFQGKLRLGGVVSREEIVHRVDQIIREFGLRKVSSSLTGGARVRISGGERKRLSLAAEVLGDPVIFFVDESTSGLDSFMAESVVMQLQRIARQGKTVLATIHQPSSELFVRLDRLYLMANGSVVYDGLAKDAVAYFSSQGYSCPAFSNPAEYFMRQLAVLDDEQDQDGAQRVQALIDSRSSQEIPSVVPVTIQTSSLTGESYKCIGKVSQMLVLSQRNAVRLLRDKLSLRVSIMQAFMTTAIVGLVYLQLDLGQTGVQNFVGVFFSIVVSQTMITANGLFSSVPLELTLIAREYQSGLYHVTRGI